ncbi:MAG: hypothetical protein OXU23_12555 [Candidatus Poribacteria bacterium]|nr:hypothetical protein [Candidatus Poribacteria bacterium]
MKNTTTPQTQKQPVHKSKAKQKRENATQNYTNLAIILKNRESCPGHNCKKVQQRKIRYKTNHILDLERI